MALVFVPSLILRYSVFSHHVITPLISVYADVFAINMLTSLCLWHHLKNRYPHLTEDDFVNSCPFCRNNCNCKTCLRANIVHKVCLTFCVSFLIYFLAWCIWHLLLFLSQVDKWKVSDDDNIKFSRQIAHFLLPWLRDFHHKQMLEKSVEATIRGIVITVWCPILRIWWHLLMYYYPHSLSLIF